MDFPKTYDNGLTVEAATAVSWANAEHTACLLRVTFTSLGEVDFGADKNDTEEHGRDLFAAAARGEFGGLAEFVLSQDDAKEKVDRLTAEATAKLTELQNEVNTLQDAVDLEMAEPEEEERLPLAKTELTAWKKYRVLLSRVPAQAGFPTSIDWPVKPA